LLILRLLSLENALEALQNRHDLLIAGRAGQQEDAGADTPDLYFVAGKPELLRQPNGLAVAMLEDLGGPHEQTLNE
jgi:hypothetical protein